MLKLFKKLNQTQEEKNLRSLIGSLKKNISRKNNPLVIKFERA